ncbi:porin family protein [uncultured Winogradskyella sp.]|uniref:porin family protein n=1 Tax=uncultured Winogradskyella sp. TaxID=395353 RepID=UPI00260C8B14|nr:porin family protein [uncultured Winogradskyella sp.]
MKKFYMFLYFVSLGILVMSQNNNNADNVELYKDYREDQFYASVTYNLLNNRPNGVSQNGFSSGFHLGFIRDMPINKRRNLAIGLGLGLSSNSYNQNISILEIDDAIIFNIIDEREINVSKNKFTSYLVEFPLEFRWRTSSASQYNFWRIYTGFKLGYVLYNSAKFKSDNGNQTLSNIDDFDKIQYGLTLSVGYDTWNFHLYYGLNPIFNGDNAVINDNAIDTTALKIGLMFYIL